eukprot:814532-Lingulodinium_polyedra.AAC.1
MFLAEPIYAGRIVPNTDLQQVARDARGYDRIGGPSDAYGRMPPAHCAGHARIRRRWAKTRKMTGQ